MDRCRGIASTSSSSTTQIFFAVPSVHPPLGRPHLCVRPILAPRLFSKHVSRGKRRRRSHWLAVRADSGAIANESVQTQPQNWRLHSLFPLHSEFDGLIFSLAIPALGTILLDPIMSMVDTGMNPSAPYICHPCSARGSLHPLLDMGTRQGVYQSCMADAYEAGIGVCVCFMQPLLGGWGRQSWRVWGLRPSCSLLLACSLTSWSLSRPRRSQQQ